MSVNYYENVNKVYEIVNNNTLIARLVGILKQQLLYGGVLS